MSRLKNKNILFSFYLIKAIAIFSAALFLGLGMEYESHAEITQEKVVSPRVRPAPAKRVITRVHRNVRRHNAKPPTQPPKKSEESIEPVEYEVEVAEPVRIERPIRVERKIPAPVYLTTETMPVRLSREDINDYIHQLKYGETIDDMEYAAKVLGSRGMTAYITTEDPIINDVYNALAGVFRQSNDEILLKETARSLGMLGREDAGSVLVNYLSYGEYNSVKSSIIWSIGRLKYKGAVNNLIRILQTDNDRILRINAASSLGVIGDGSAVYPLISTLSDNDPDVKKTVIGSLGSIGAQEAKYPLMNILNYDQDLEMREAAAVALRKIEEKNGR